MIGRSLPRCRRLHPVAVCGIAFLLGWMAMAPSMATAQTADRKMRSILDLMAVQQRNFDARPLHNMGMDGLVRLLDFLLPDTADIKQIRLPDDMAALIEQLGDDNYQVRKEAFERLLDMGPSVQEVLKIAAKSDDAEIRRRATQILRRWADPSDADKQRYARAFYMYSQGISDEPRLEELTRRTLLALEEGMPVDRGRKDILAYMMQAVARSRKDPYVDRFKPLLDHEDVEVARFVVQTVAGGTGSSSYLPNLLLAAFESKREEVVKEVVMRSINCSDPKRREELKKRLIKVFEGDDASLKFTACYPLTRDHQYEPAMDHLLEKVLGEDRVQADQAMKWLGNSRNLGREPSAKMLATFDKLLASEDWNRRRSACRTLAMWSGKGVVERLIPLLGDPKASIATEVEYRLMHQRDKKMLADMLRTASKEHENETVRKKATSVLEKVDRMLKR
jgi:HEAT repeat protein